MQMFTELQENSKNNRCLKQTTATAQRLYSAQILIS